MKLYRVHKYHPLDGSCGYQYFAEHGEAVTERKEWLAGLDKDLVDKDIKNACTLDLVDVPTRKRENLIAWLHEWASHPNDG